jgi:hypothetical protein
VSRRVEYVEIDGRIIAWPVCIVPYCENGICFDISMDFCFPHSAERLNIYPHFDWTLDLQTLVPWEIRC